MTFDARYADQVRLLLRVLPLVAQEKDFALKGGTAINLFVRDMPRLSVDIDLAYLPDHGRADALGRSREALTRIQGRIKAQLPGVNCLQHNRGDDDLKLVVRQGRVQVKVEVNPVVRGSLHTPEERDVSEAVEDEFGFASASVLALPDLYGGKLCAALDRQHPRDLFDVHLLLENEGIDRPLFEGFLVYLMSHPRPMAELLAPRWRALDQVHADEFAGMSREAVAAETLQAVGDALLKALAAHLTDADIEFLLSFKRGEPDWRRCPVPKAESLPAVQWKLRNINAMTPEKRAAAVARLEEVLRLLSASTMEP